jgi:Flp pilus assembly protein TadG
MMPIPAPGSDTRSPSRRLRTRGQRGSVSIEVVLIVPMMLFALLGFFEMYTYMRAVSLVEHTAFTLADSIGQMTQVINETTTADANSLGSIWSAAALIGQPNAMTANGGVIITSICDQTTTPCGTTPPASQSMANGTPMIYWTQKAPWTQSGMTSLENSTNVLPSTWPFRNGDSAIVVEVFYRFTPFAMTSAFWKGAPGSTILYRRVYVRPRYVKTALQLVSPT